MIERLLDLAQARELGDLSPKVSFSYLRMTSQLGKLLRQNRKHHVSIADDGDVVRVFSIPVVIDDGIVLPYQWLLMSLFDGNVYERGEIEFCHCGSMVRLMADGSSVGMCSGCQMSWCEGEISRCGREDVCR